MLTCWQRASLKDQDGGDAVGEEGFGGDGGVVEERSSGARIGADGRAEFAIMYVILFKGCHYVCDYIQC